ncbi:hypothetical protein HND97_04375 [Vibrio cholerae]|nr:hypothetical protein HND97_04375 [Vibrio cholerae]
MVIRRTLILLCCSVHGVLSGTRQHSFVIGDRVSIVFGDYPVCPAILAVCTGEKAIVKGLCWFSGRFYPVAYHLDECHRYAGGLFQQ